MYEEMQTTNGKVLKAFLINISQPIQDNWRNLICKFIGQKVHIKIKKQELYLLENPVVVQVQFLKHEIAGLLELE